MKTLLDHVPDDKRARLGAIADLFRARVPLGLLVLFGSHARGDWVDDPETGDQSDFDLLAVMRDEAQADDVGFWPELEGAMRAAAGATPVTLIVHDVKGSARQGRRAARGRGAGRGRGAARGRGAGAAGGGARRV